MNDNEMMKVGYDKIVNYMKTFEELDIDYFADMDNLELLNEKVCKLRDALEHLHKAIFFTVGLKVMESLDK